jgi:hypothetical protein
MKDVHELEEFDEGDKTSNLCKGAEQALWIARENVSLGEESEIYFYLIFPKLPRSP